MPRQPDRGGSWRGRTSDASETLGFTSYGHSIGHGFRTTLRLCAEGLVYTSLVTVPVLLAARGQQVRHARLLWITLWTPIVGYAFWWSHGGNRYGPRFYFEALLPFTILVGAGLDRLARRWPPLRLSTALAAATIVMNIVIGARVAGEIFARRDVYRVVAAAGLRRAVVLLRTASADMVRIDLNRNPPNTADAPGTVRPGRRAIRPPGRQGTPGAPGVLLRVAAGRRRAHAVLGGPRSRHTMKIVLERQAARGSTIRPDADGVERCTIVKGPSCREQLGLVVTGGRRELFERPTIERERHPRTGDPGVVFDDEQVMRLLEVTGRSPEERKRVGDVVQRVCQHGAIQTTERPWHIEEVGEPGSDRDAAMSRSELCEGCRIAVHGVDRAALREKLRESQRERAVTAAEVGPVLWNRAGKVRRLEHGDGVSQTHGSWGHDEGPTSASTQSARRTAAGARAPLVSLNKTPTRLV